MPEPELNPYAAPSREADQELGSSGLPAAGPLATLWQRFLGALLDLALVLFVVMLWSFALAFWLMSSGREPHYLTSYGTLVALLVLLGIVQWTLIAKSGQSIGKRMVKTRIVRMDGSSAGFLRGVLLRSWVPLASSLIPIAGGIINLVDALWVFTDERRALHDHIAGTKVIQT
jgi:uncharacterized RDD family membrane protein YckC